MGRNIIIGLDGVPFRLIEDLTAAGTMPNLRDTINDGVFLQMASSVPAISSVAWSSIITGANPGRHGIYGFTDLAPGTYRLRFLSFNDLKVAPFWLDTRNGRSIIINVPSTYPAKRLNGVLIAGFVAPDLTRATFPPSMLPTLEALNYQIDVDTEKAHQSKELFLRHLDETLKTRIAVYRYLWDAQTWQNFMLVFTGTDRLGHFMWDAYEDPKHPLREAFLEHFRRIDQAIGEILGRLTPDDSLIVLSDHGFERLEKTANVNAFLREHGFLKFKHGSARSLNDIEEGTSAFALDPARIYVHTRDRYPRGTLKEEDAPAVVRDLVEAFSSWKIHNRPVINQVHHRDDIYQGPQVDSAPDLVLTPQTGFDLQASVRSDGVSQKRPHTGKHTGHDAFLIARGPRLTQVPDALSVSDVLHVFTTL
jgi:predicted AlkP superfamily phosphohydrolase/phosphomutase